MQAFSKVMIIIVMILTSNNKRYIVLFLTLYWPAGAMSIGICQSDIHNPAEHLR